MKQAINIRLEKDVVQTLDEYAQMINISKVNIKENLEKEQGIIE